MQETHVTRPPRLACLVLLVLAAFGLTATVRAADLTDATGRTVSVPDSIARVLPAGPPAAVLLEILAPDLLVGWPHPPTAESAARLPPPVAALPAIQALTGDADAVAEVAALHPDLILDYGTISPRYVALARATQDATGVPTVLLDGRLDAVPATLRQLGAVLHRQARADLLARLAEAALAAAPAPRDPVRVVYVHGAEGVEVAVPGGSNSGLFATLGWRLLAPEGTSPGAFRPASPAQIAALDPDILLFGNPAMRRRAATDPAWRGVRAIQQHHAWVVPGLPFGWIEGPPSVNRLLGLAWLGGGAPSEGVLPFALTFHALAYGQALTAEQTDALRQDLRPIEP